MSLDLHKKACRRSYPLTKIPVDKDVSPMVSRAHHKQSELSHGLKMREALGIEQVRTIPINPHLQMGKQRPRVRKKLAQGDTVVTW